MIPQIEPWIDQRELDQLQEVVASTWLVEGPKTQLFEERFAALVQCRHALAVSNATAGLYCCLLALGVGEGDEVIVPDMTFIATANAVIWTGAEPVLVDIDERTCNIDPSRIEERITPRTKVIIPVHLFGQAADMEAIGDIAAAHDLAIVEDAAQGVGASFQGRHVGAWGRVGCFSFYGNKTITTGQGGMITTDDEELARKCLILKNQGRTEKGTFVHPNIGYNFCFTDLQAAVGLAQLNKLDEILDRKARIDRRYRSLLADVPSVRFPERDARCQGALWFTNVLVDDPVALGQHLASREIGTRRFFYPLHRQPCYQGKWAEEFPVCDRIYRRGLSLPSAATLTDDEVAFVCGRVREFYGLRAEP